RSWPRKRPADRAGGVGRHLMRSPHHLRLGADRLYGYGWWIQDFKQGTYFAWGYGGQYVFVFRELDLVVAATSSTTVSEERRGHRRRLFELIEQRILGPLRAAPVG